MYNEQPTEDCFELTIAQSKARVDPGWPASTFGDDDVIPLLDVEPGSKVLANKSSFAYSDPDADTHLLRNNLLQMVNTLLLQGGKNGGKVGKPVDSEVHPGLLHGLETRYQHLWGLFL